MNPFRKSKSVPATCYTNISRQHRFLTLCQFALRTTNSSVLIYLDSVASNPIHYVLLMEKIWRGKCVKHVESRLVMANYHLCCGALQYVCVGVRTQPPLVLQRCF